MDAYWDEGSIPWINSGTVNQALISEPSDYITEEGFNNSSAQWLPVGALVIALAGQGKTKGLVAQTAIKTTCNQSMAAICPRNTEITRYLYWLLSAQYEAIRGMAGTEQRDGLNLEIVGSIPCLLAPNNELMAIADFLDRETIRLDTLVAKKRELTDKLKEKRSALISRTVTRGLPPDAARAAGLDPHPRLNPSGVEWLGAVPEHWEVKAIKWLSQVRRGASPRPIDDPIYFDDDGEFAWVRISDVTTAGMYLQYTEQNLSVVGSSLSVKLEPGSMFLSIAGTVGKPCIASIKCCIHDGFVYFPDWKGESRFLYYIFASGEPYKGLGKFGTQLNLNTDTVGKIKIGCPPAHEQHVIADYLDKELTKIDLMIGTVEAAINKLQEYRTALITAAVTGKIDVRGESLTSIVTPVVE